MESDSDFYTLKFRSVMFYFVGAAVSKGENSKDISDDGDESS